HYLRARLILNTCSRYYTEPVDGCSSRFASAGAAASSASAASAGDTDPILRRTTAALQGKDPDSVAPLPRPEASSPLRSPQMTATPQGTPAPKPKAKAVTPAAEPAQPKAQPPADANEGEAVLDYLFGKDGQ
ncbi:MAG: hypothetical protein M3N56_03045, partial [Actinomycetota bacterium]|nr:hypothetical protein [Actinomycetota bacterium]